jgi:hypothetical protein
VSRDASPFGFLTAIQPRERQRGMELEVRSALSREMETVLNPDAQSSGVFSTFLRILRRPSSFDTRNIEYFETAYANIEKWISRDTTDEFVSTLKDGRPFGLYLRAYKSECAEELAGVPDVNAWRSVEIANVARVSEKLPIYGLCNCLDMNPLQKYRSVWLPPQFRPQWLQIVVELANVAALVIINATRPGSSLSDELRAIPQGFPEKTWLIIAKQESDASLPDAIADAVRKLSEYPDHVSISEIKDGIVHDAWPLCPLWVQSIMVNSTQRQSRD